MISNESIGNLINEFAKVIKFVSDPEQSEYGSFKAELVQECQKLKDLQGATATNNHEKSLAVFKHAEDVLNSRIRLLKISTVNNSLEKQKQLKNPILEILKLNTIDGERDLADEINSLFEELSSADSKTLAEMDLKTLDEKSSELCSLIFNIIKEQLTEKCENVYDTLFHEFKIKDDKVTKESIKTMEIIERERRCNGDTTLSGMVRILKSLEERKEESLDALVQAFDRGFWIDQSLIALKQTKLKFDALRRKTRKGITNEAGIACFASSLDSILDINGDENLDSDANQAPEGFVSKNTCKRPKADELPDDLDFLDDDGNEKEDTKKDTKEEDQDLNSSPFNSVQKPKFESCADAAEDSDEDVDPREEAKLLNLADLPDDASDVASECSSGRQSRFSSNASSISLESSSSRSRSSSFNSPLLESSKDCIYRRRTASGNSSELQLSPSVHFSIPEAEESLSPICESPVATAVPVFAANVSAANVSAANVSAANVSAANVSEPEGVDITVQQTESQAAGQLQSHSNPEITRSENSDAVVINGNNASVNVTSDIMKGNEPSTNTATIGSNTKTGNNSNKNFVQKEMLTMYIAQSRVKPSRNENHQSLSMQTSTKRAITWHF